MISPFLEQWPQLNREQRWGDVVAGLVTALLFVPQAMAYALLAGLPASAGLTAAVVAPVVYGFLGSSRTMSVGPVAVAALMVATAIGPVVAAGHSALAATVVLAAEVAALLLLAGALRLGLFASFISHPVIKGFTAAAAVLIITSQLPALLGVQIEGGHFAAKLLQLLQSLGQTDLMTVALSLLCIAVLWPGKRLLAMVLQRLGAGDGFVAMMVRALPLLLVVCGIVATSLLSDGAERPWSVVGAVPSGLPLPLSVLPDSSLWYPLLPSAALLALIAYVESVSVAKVLSTKDHSRIDNDRELWSLGVSNAIAALFAAMPVAGGFSRSVVNSEAGANSQFASFIAATGVLLSCLLFANGLALLPHAVLAAVIVVAVSQLIDIPGAMAVYRYSRGDGLALIATAVAVLLLGLEQGLVVGIAVSLFSLIWRSSQPHIVVLGRVPGRSEFRNAEQRDLQQLPGVLFVRIDESLYFGNSGRVEDWLRQQRLDDPDLVHLVLVMTPVNAVDSSALDDLERFNQELENEGCLLHLCEVKGPVKSRMEHTALWQHLREQERLHRSAEAAWIRLECRIWDGADAVYNSA